MTSFQSSGDISTAAYQILSIVQSAAPSDSEGTWFRYVIVQGANQIIGWRAGSAKEVEFAVRVMVDGLNERSKGNHVKKTKPEPALVVQATSAPAQSQP